jgi:hypothetical protein
MRRRPPKSPARSSSRYNEEYDDRRYDDEDFPVEKPKGKGLLNWSTMAILGAVLAFGIVLGITFSSATTSNPGSVATRYDIDKSAPNPELCVQYGASAVAVDMRAFVTLSPFAVHISQPKMQPGCVLRTSNVNVLQSRGLVDSKTVNDCRTRFNTFAFTGDIEKKDDNARRVDCVYQNNAAGNLFLPQTGGGDGPSELNNF